MRTRVRRRNRRCASFRCVGVGSLQEVVFSTGGVRCWGRSGSSRPRSAGSSLAAGPADATPVCTDGYKGGPPLALCGGRIFPESHNAIGYVQYSPYPEPQAGLGPAGFREYQDGIDFMAQKYPRFVTVTNLSDVYGENAVSAGADVKRAVRQRRHRRRPGDPGDQDHRQHRARRRQAPPVLLAVDPRQRARRPRGRHAYRRGPRDGRHQRRPRSPTAWPTTSPRPAARRSSTTTRSASC